VPQETLVSFASSRKTPPMRNRLLVILAAIYCPNALANSDASPLKAEWKACVRTSDCTVIHVNGCPWDSIAIAIRYSEEVRIWAQTENARHNCTREAVSMDLKKGMRARCDNRTCTFAQPSPSEK